ncbi:MAG: methyltransferase domain-containing protein [Acidobacteria bacterium]|nr:methyltransferase domain-containing protein [Acidobacteriota bacterium]
MRDAPNSTSLREHMLLFSRFLRSPRTVGAVTPSSRAVGEAMVANLDFSKPLRIVELGAGTGALTAPIVERLGPHNQFLAIDIDPAFCKNIQKRWPGIECICASAERLDTIVVDRGMAPVDHIVSGLPFVSLPIAVTRQILRSIAAVLRPGGTFTTFQYLHAYKLPSAVAFRKQMSGHMGSLPHVHLVVRNFPPALILTWTKQG